MNYQPTSTSWTPPAGGGRKFCVGDLVTDRATGRDGVVDSLVNQTEYRVCFQYGIGATAYQTFFEHELDATGSYRLPLAQWGQVVGVPASAISPVRGSVSGVLATADTHTTKKVSDYFLGDVSMYMGTSEEEKKKRREEGRCEECGTLRAMSVYGLLDCPQHPKPAGPQ